MTNDTKVANGGILRYPVDGSMKKLVATWEKNRGDRPKATMAAAEASPIWAGKAFDAVNREEPYLQVMSTQLYFKTRTNSSREDGASPYAKIAEYHAVE